MTYDAITKYVTLTFTAEGSVSTFTWLDTASVSLNGVQVQFNATDAKLHDIKIETKMVPEAQTVGLFLLSDAACLFLRRMM